MTNPLPAHLPAFSSVFIPRSALARTRVLVVGDVMLDRYWFGEVTRISPEAPVPVVQVRQCQDRLGGAANVARNIVSLGARATLVGTVGNDEAGVCVMQLLQDAAVTQALQVSSGGQTIVKLRVLGGQQQLLRLDFDGDEAARGRMIDTGRLHQLVRSHHLLVLSDYAKGSLADPQALIGIARTCRRPVLVDPKARDFSGYAHATMITPNCDELMRVIGPWQGEHELAERAQALRRSLNLRALMLTRASEGMSLFDDSGTCHSPAQAREVFDVCGAGDTVIAVLASLLASGVQCREAMDIANRAAGIAVSKLGTSAVQYEELFGETEPEGRE